MYEGWLAAGIMLLASLALGGPIVFLAKFIGPRRKAPQKAAAYEMGTKLARNKDGKAPMGRMRKCTYCFHRLQSGTLPACATTCIGHATFFGDLNDADSLIFELSGSPRMRRLKESAGTKPTTFYLV